MDDVNKIIRILLEFRCLFASARNSAVLTLATSILKAVGAIGCSKWEEAVGPRTQRYACCLVAENEPGIRTPGRGLPRYARKENKIL